MKDTTMPTLQEVMTGYESFNDWERAEQQTELPRLTVSESLRQFFSLCDSIESWRPNAITEQALIEVDESGWIALKRRLIRNT